MHVCIYTVHSGGKVPPKCNAICIIKYKEDRLDVLDCVTPGKAKNQSMEKVQTR
jgi:Zn ribbon nucleic-acid-binding protein